MPDSRGEYGAGQGGTEGSRRTAGSEPAAIIRGPTLVGRITVENGILSFPAEVRERLTLAGGDLVLISCDAGCLVLRRVRGLRLL